MVSTNAMMMMPGAQEIAQLADWDEETITTVVAAVLGIGAGLGIPIFFVTQEKRDKERIEEIRELNRATLKATGEQMSEEEIRAVASGRSFATLFSDRATILADYDWALEKQRVLNETKASTEQEELPEKEANERKEERKKLEAQVAAKKVRYRNLFDSYRIRFDRGYRRAVAKLTNLETEEIRLRARNPVTHVQVEKMDSSPMARILNRGQYDQPGEAV